MQWNRQYLNSHFMKIVHHFFWKFDIHYAALGFYYVVEIGNMCSEQYKIDSTINVSKRYLVFAQHNCLNLFLDQHFLFYTFFYVFLVRNHNSVQNSLFIWFFWPGEKLKCIFFYFSVQNVKFLKNVSRILTRQVAEVSF